MKAVQALSQFLYLATKANFCCLCARRFTLYNEVDEEGGSLTARTRTVQGLGIEEEEGGDVEGD